MAPPVADGPPPARDPAARQRLRGFLNHLIAYFAVMVVVVPINAATTPQTPWFLFLLVGWGAPLAIHAAYAMGLLRRRSG
ncbi:2TM domain-containing protein [Azospirillum halopraeferens]|uniref:2TM domain-containing protein n=1 Tax=Azospirillum halopraeferens TaxID=34010 RepID=UPI0003F580D7|nr:2TM domain-containing protein [Azospirillum halopraeferens]